MKKNNLKLIILDNFKEVGDKVNEEIKKVRKSKKGFEAQIINSRFSNGEGKIKIEESIRDKDLYILCDVGNYSINYLMHDMTHYMSPDEHFQDIKRIISATNGRSEKITLIMPLLYQSRQHKRKGRESLDCALALQDLENLGVDNIITFDAHDPNVSNAIPNLPFENFYPTHTILEDLIKNEDIENLLVVSPDMGAMERSRYYAEMLGCDVGVFYKRRDLSKVVNGKNPIVDHIYMGADVKGKNILVVDDMIASGGSMIDVAINLKERGASKVYLVATFALFTEGTEKFKKAYEDGLFDKLYSTNLSYVAEEIRKCNWYHEVDFSMLIAQIIDALNKKESIEKYQNGKKEMFKKIKNKKSIK
jgi:ribose-phosphate pyrophosphokinase